MSSFSRLAQLSCSAACGRRGGAGIQSARARCCDRSGRRAPAAGGDVVCWILIDAYGADFRAAGGLGRRAVPTVPAQTSTRRAPRPPVRRKKPRFARLCHSRPAPRIQLHACRIMLLESMSIRRRGRSPPAAGAVPPLRPLPFSQHRAALPRSCMRGAPRRPHAAEPNSACACERLERRTSPADAVEQSAHGCRRAPAKPFLKRSAAGRGGMCYERLGPPVATSRLAYGLPRGKRNGEVVCVELRPRTRGEARAQRTAPSRRAEFQLVIIAARVQALLRRGAHTQLRVRRVDDRSILGSPGQPSARSACSASSRGVAGAPRSLARVAASSRKRATSAFRVVSSRARVTGAKHRLFGDLRDPS